MKKKLSILVSLIMVFTIILNPVNTMGNTNAGKTIDKHNSHMGKEHRSLGKGIIGNNPFGAVKADDGLVNSAIPLKASRTLLSMTEARNVEVSVDFGYKPELKNLLWTFGGKQFSDWKKWNQGRKDYSGEAFIRFIENPAIEGTTVKATIGFDLVYGTGDLSDYYIRTLYPALIGAYKLSVKDSSSGKLAENTLKYNVYDSYHKYDEIKPAIDSIMSNAKKDRYIEYTSIGKSAEGRDLHFAVIAKDKLSVDQYLNITKPLMVQNPQELINMINQGTLGNYKVPVFFNNIHPDEAPGIDAIIDIFNMFATKDTVTYKMKSSNGTEIDTSSDLREILDHVILLFDFTENPDGRYYNTRENVNGFDLNRDNAYQSQPEPKAVTREIAKWSPISFLDFHGFVPEFLIEPCTAPHEPNLEYDLLIDSMLEQAKVMGDIAVANTKYDSYIIPYNDFAGGWDDSTPSYTASYAMEHGALGHTIEIPELNEASHDALVYTGLASTKYVSENKKKLFLNQLEYFRRSINGEDNRIVDKWLINAAGQEIGRPRGDNQNFFPDYYILPVDKKLQKNPAEVYNMIEYLIRNDVKIEKTSKNVTIGTTAYPAGSFVIPMHQAKRGYANCVLYNGIDVSDFSEIYAEIVLNFQDLKGFDRYEIRQPGILDKIVEKVTYVIRPGTQIPVDSKEYIVKNTNNDAIKAVNRLLGMGKTVKIITSNGKNYEKGDFVVTKDGLLAVSNNYMLEILPGDNTLQAKEIKKVKVAAIGMGQTTFTLKQLGFEVVNDVNNSDIIVDDYGLAENYRSIIKAGKDYIGIGGFALDSVKKSNILSDFNYGNVDPRGWGFYYEGLLRAELNQDSIITACYPNNDYVYAATGSWITSVPDGSKVLARIGSGMDYYKAGWWPGHEALKGQIFAMTYSNNGADITLFANDLTNKGHPENSYRMLANSIFADTNNIE